MTRSCPAIQSIDGVASADLTGSLEPQVTVTLDPPSSPTRVSAIQQILGVLQANNITVPVGQLQQRHAHPRFTDG